MKLKIGPLTNLQDARYSAAVGMSLVSFSLARGDHRKLSVATVWNIAQWLEGPEIVLDLNKESLDEIEDLGVDARYLSFPREDYDPSLFNYNEAIILQADEWISVDLIAESAQEAKSRGFELKYEIRLREGADPTVFEQVAEHIFLHFPRLEDADAFIANPSIPVCGVSFGEEAEEEPQVLHYEMLDDIAARFTDVHL